MDTADWNEYLEWEFETAGRAPIMWYRTARSLLVSAEELFDQFKLADSLSSKLWGFDENRMPVARKEPISVDEQKLLRAINFGPISLMLLGFSLENLCKGLLVRDDVSRVSAERGISALHTHDLLKLVRNCGYEPNEDEQTALTQLTHYVKWAGRYPIPSKPLGTDRTRKGDGFWVKQRMAHPSWIWEHAYSLFDTLAGDWDGSSASLA